MTTSQGDIFYSLQHFTTKLHNFSKRGMLFQAVVIVLPISIFFKILSNGGKVHWVEVEPRYIDPLLTRSDWASGGQTCNGMNFEKNFDKILNYQLF